MKLSSFSQWLWLFHCASSQSTVQRCEPLVFIANGRILSYVDSDSNNKTFARAFFTCFEGFLPAVPTAALCSSQMTWTPALSCRIVTCNMPKKPINGRLLSITGIIFASSVTYRCLEGYLPQDVKTSVCNRSGVWGPSPTEHTCTIDAQAVISDAEMEEPEPGLSSSLIFVSALTSSAFVLLVGMMTFGFLFVFFFSFPTNSTFSKWKKKLKSTTKATNKLGIGKCCPCPCLRLRLHLPFMKRKQKYPPKKRSIFSDDSEYTRRSRARGHSIYSDNPDDYLTDHETISRSSSRRYSLAPSSRRYSRDDSSFVSSSRRYSRGDSSFYISSRHHSRSRSAPASKVQTTSATSSSFSHGLSQKPKGGFDTKTSSGQYTSKADHFPHNQTKRPPPRHSANTWTHGTPTPPSSPRHPNTSLPHCSPPVPQPSTPHTPMGQRTTVQKPQPMQSQSYRKHSPSPDAKHQQPLKTQCPKPSHPPTGVPRSPSPNIRGSPKKGRKTTLMMHHRSEGSMSTNDSHQTGHR